MTLFEYLAIAFSLVFSFTSMRLVAGLPHAFQASRRYWVHSCLVICQLLVTLVIFWTFWSFKGTDWRFPTFMLVLLNPGLIYFNACTLIPENPSGVESWRDYFMAIKLRYFIGVLCWQCVVVLNDILILQQPLFHPVRGFQIAWLAVTAVGALSKSHRVLAGVALSMLFMGAFISLTLAFEPGSFSGE